MSSRIELTRGENRRDLSRPTRRMTIATARQGYSRLLAAVVQH
jgi:hypothetical protein